MNYKRQWIVIIFLVNIDINVYFTSISYENIERARSDGIESSILIEFRLKIAQPILIFLQPQRNIHLEKKYVFIEMGNLRTYREEKNLCDE